MPRTYPPRRTHLTVRLSTAEVTAVQHIADTAHNGDRSAAIRQLISEAVAARSKAAPALFKAKEE